MQILLVKEEGYKFARNPNAHFLELFCNTHFYGPMVVGLNKNMPPFSLQEFKKEYLAHIRAINQKLKSNYPPPFVPTNS